MNPGFASSVLSNHGRQEREKGSLKDGAIERGKQDTKDDGKTAGGLNWGGRKKGRERGTEGRREGDLHRGGGVREEVMSETEVTVM